MSPPLDMDAHGFSPHVACTMAKYGMSECTLAVNFIPDLFPD